MRYIRGVLALVVGCVLFALCGLSTMGVALITLRLGDPLLHAPMRAGQVMLVVVYRLLLRMKVRIEGKVQHIDVPTIVIGNHPSLPLTMLYTAYLEELVGQPMIFVAKWEHLYNPFIGWPLWLAKLGIFINRSKRGDACSTLRATMQDVFDRGAALVIFPDQSRPTAKRIANDHDKYADRVADVEEFTDTLVPRDGGVGSLLDAAPDNVRVIDVTFGCTHPNVRWRDILAVSYGMCVMNIRDVTGEIPANPEDRRRWLVERWRWKNQKLRGLRGA